MLNDSSLRTVDAVLIMLKDAMENVSDAIDDLTEITVESKELNLVKLAESILSQPRGGDKQWE